MKVQLVGSSDHQWFTPLDQEEFVTAVVAQGVEVVDSDPDVVLSSSRAKPTDKPTIVLDQWDTSCLTKTTTDVWDDLPNTLGYVVPLKSSGASLNDRDRGKTGKPIYPFTTLLWQCRDKYLWDPLPIKDIEVSFAGTLHYKRPHHAMGHREDLVKHWAQLASRRSYGVFGSIPRLLSWEESYRLCARSRVVVSPWGVCEISWRDYEAAIAGAVIVKPQQPFIAATASPWCEECTIYCKRDFSDLGYVVSQALELRADHLQAHRERLLNAATDIKSLAAEFIRIVREITSS